MSHDEASRGPEPQPTILPPGFERPRWRLLATLLAIGASLSIASNLAQLEQRLIPGLLDSPPWLAPVVYVGVTCLPLVQVIRLAFLEARCAYVRIRWYNRLHELATAMAGELRTQRRRASEQATMMAEQRETIDQQSTLIARSTAVVSLLHVAFIVEPSYEDGRLTLIAESRSRLRIEEGDVFIVFGAERLERVGTFRLTRHSERGLHLSPVRIEDALSWTNVRREARSGAFRHGALVAILSPHE